MVWDAVLINVVLQALTIMIVNSGIAGAICLGSIHPRRGLRRILPPVFMKVFFVNFIFGGVVKYYLEGMRFYSELYCAVSILSTLAMILYIAYESKDGLDKIIFLCLTGDAVAVLCTSSLGLLAGALSGKPFFKDLSAKPDGYNVLVICAGIFLICFLLFGKGKVLLERLRRHKVKYRKPCIFLFIGMQAAGLYTTMIWAFASGQGMMPTYALTILVIIASVLIYFCYQQALKNSLYQENRALLLRHSLMTEYYAALQEQLRLTRKFRHDMKNHMQTLETLAELYKDKKEICDYAETLKNQYGQLQRISFCKNTVIDSVIYNKVKDCEKNSIRTDIDMVFFDAGEIPDIDILEILYNLFDNAIEACKRIEKAEARFISLSGRTLASRPVLKLKNSSNGVIVKNGRLASSKKDKEQHGIGMRIIEELVKKHNGSMDIHIQEGIFEIIISMDSCKEQTVTSSSVPIIPENVSNVPRTGQNTETDI